MLNGVKEQLRAFAHRKLEATDRRKLHPVAVHALNLASIVNELMGRPIRGADEIRPGTPASPGATKERPVNGVNGAGGAAGAASDAAVPAVPVPRPQAPVVLYFDGKDHRTRAKVEELLRSRDIAFKVLDVSDDEAERSWITTAAKTSEFPIVVVAGNPVGGLAELTQLDLQGELIRRVFTVQ
jgi:glutaredoxin